MKANEIRELASKDILERIAAERDQLVKMKINHAVSPLDNPTLIKKSRKNVARMLTILREKELNK